MAKTKKNPVNYAFIDSQNLYLGVKSQGWELDYARFRVYLRDKYKVSKAFLFIGYVSGNEALYTYFQECGFVVVFKPTLEIKRGTKFEIKGNVDAELVLHTMIEYKNFDKAVIVSGDGDFHCLIEYLDKKNKMGTLLVPSERGFSHLLRKFRIYVVYLRSLRSKLEQKKRGNNLRTKP